MVTTATDILTTEQICEFLHIQRNTLYNKKWRKLIDIPVFKQGKYLFALKAKFFGWYQARAVIDG